MKNNVSILTFFIFLSVSCSKKVDNLLRLNTNTLSTTNANVSTGQTVTFAANKSFAEPYYDTQSTLGISLDNNADSSTITNWTNTATSVNWYYYLTASKINFIVNATLTSGQTNSFRFYIINPNTSAILDSADVNVTGTGASADYTLKTNINIDSAHFYKFKLQPLSKTGTYYANINLVKVAIVSGTNVTVRNSVWMNSPSVHQSWYNDNGSKTHDWFYTEVEVPTGYDPVYTYWMSIGVNRAYMGMQRNFDNEKRFIFSAWDADDAGEAPSSMYKTKILDYGTNVVTDGFGGEGTGGHSHYVYNWQTGSTVKFLMHAKRLGAHDIIYSAWWSDATNTSWQYLTTFDLPYDSLLFVGGFYGFLEDFGTGSGSAIRKGIYKNSWAHIVNGAWENYNKTWTDHTDGAADSRSDYVGGLVPSNSAQTYLQSGGYTQPNLASTTIVTNNSSAPNVDTVTLLSRVNQAIRKGDPLVPGAIYEIKSALDTSNNLEVYGGYTAAETKVDIYSDNNYSHQRWQLQYISNGYFRIIPQNATNSSLDVYGGFSTSGTKVEIYPNNGENAQLWYFTSLSNGNYKLTPKCAPSLALNAVSSSSGADVNVSTDDGSTNQQWKIDIVL